MRTLNIAAVQICSAYENSLTEPSVLRTTAACKGEGNKTVPALQQYTVH